MARDPHGSDWSFGLLDERIDWLHRLSRRVPHPAGAADVTVLGVIRTWTPRVAWRLDPRWTARLAYVDTIFSPYVPFVLTFFLAWQAERYRSTISRLDGASHGRGRAGSTRSRRRRRRPCRERAVTTLPVRPLLADSSCGPVAAGDSHFPSPIRGDGPYSAGRLPASWPPYRGRCCLPAGAFARLARGPSGQVLGSLSACSGGRVLRLPGGIEARPALAVAVAVPVGSAALSFPYYGLTIFFLVHRSSGWTVPRTTNRCHATSRPTCCGCSVGCCSLAAGVRPYLLLKNLDLPLCVNGVLVINDKSNCETNTFIDIHIV